MMTAQALRIFAALTLLTALTVPGVEAQDKPRPGGILTWFDYGDPGRLDVHAESPLVVQQATAGVYSGLLHYDPDDPSRVVGDLAERWTVSPDGKTYTFHLRKGVKWHDGQPFSAADVKASFDRILNPDFQSPKCGASLKPMVAAVEMVDANTVQFRLKFPAAPFLPSLASAWCRVAAKHILAKYGDLNQPEAQIGTGPFKFKKYERGSVIEWEKNPPFDNPDLRRAVNLAIDRQELVAKALEGAGVPCGILDPKLSGDFALPLEEVNRIPGCRQPKDQDIAEAKKLVEKHHPNGVDIEIAVRSVGNYVDRAQLVIAQLRKAGIRGTLKTHESAAGYAAFGKGDFTVIATQDRAMDVNDPSGVFHIAYTTEGGSNYGRMSDPKIDELAERALKESNKDKRRQAYWELQRYILTRGDTATVAVAWVEGWFFKDKKLQNYKPGLTVYDNNTFMRVWLTP